jgi:hypothetical protein
MLCSSLAALPAPAAEVVVPLLREPSGHVSVALLLDGQPARLLVDTGANASTLDATLGKRFGATIAVAPGAPEGTPAQATLSVASKDAPLGSETFTVMDLSFINFLPRRMGAPLFDGQLGASFFAATRATIDFERMELRLVVPERSGGR